MSQELKIALCQMTSVDDVARNLQSIKILMSTVATDSGVRLFCFPENCLYMRLREGEAIPPFSIDDPIFQELAEIAKDRNAFIHLGSVPLLLKGSLYNSSVIISDTGQLETSYQKIHLFDIQLEDQKAIRESDIFRHGVNPSMFKIDGWKIAQSICYDLRFAELYSQYARLGADVILVPSAFLTITGEAHWEVLLRARAIESQCYVIAAAQAGWHVASVGEGARATYGNSMAIGPWGGVIKRLSSDRPQADVCLLSRTEILKSRLQIPMSDHRRILPK